jgi:hypothetical protein
MKRQALLTIPAALVAVALGPAPASAAKLFTGETQQDRKITVRIGDDGRVNLARVSWRTRRCRTGEYLQDTTEFRQPFDGATPDAFNDVGTYSIRQRGGYRIRVSITLDGERVVDPANPAAESWRGTVKTTATIRRNGRTIDRCTLRSTGWTAVRR